VEPEFLIVRPFMTGKVFVDSNVLVYAHDGDAGVKQQQAASLLKELWESGCGRLSTQVLQEFYTNVTQKIKRPLARSVAREVIRNYGIWVEYFITPSTVVRASEISETWMLSFWDSMILAAAEQNSAEELLTEDLNHGQVIAGIQVVNPFR
jgi:predicted nucleic acid-binding protein